MGTKAQHAWLLALSDPLGPPEVLPTSRLSVPDLEQLCDLGARHGVLPAVIANVKRVAARQGPDRFLAAGASPADEALAGAMTAAGPRLLQGAALSLLLRRQACEVTAALLRESVPATVIKGPEFADRLYSSPSLRQFTDVDVLVPQALTPQAHRVMEGLGYRPCQTRMKRSTGYGELAWRRRDAEGAVEVHWDLVNSPSLRSAVSVQYDDLRWTPADGASCAARLSGESLLLIAAVHGAASHGFDRLQVLYDVAQAARGAAGPLDDAWLAEAARRTGAAFALATALRLCETVLGERRCGQLLERLALRAPGRLGALLLSRRAILSAHARRDSLRRQAFRELLKRL
jgi:hypothetical protein